MPVKVVEKKKRKTSHKKTGCYDSFLCHSAYPYAKKDINRTPEKKSEFGRDKGNDDPGR